MTRFTPPFADYGLEVARGQISDVEAVNKWGRNIDINGTSADVWDGPTAVWIPPAQSRIHDIASTSALDTAPQGAGARTIQIWGLPNWDDCEITEVIEMNGTSDVPTVNAYAIIHRMQVITKGATAGNVGTITATSPADGSVTALISPDIGQSRMAILGVPSCRNLYLRNFGFSLNGKGGVHARWDGHLAVNSEPDVMLVSHIDKHTILLDSDGGSVATHQFDPPLRIPGPAIVFLHGEASAANSDVTGDFDGYLIKE